MKRAAITLILCLTGCAATAFDDPATGLHGGAIRFLDSVSFGKLTYYRQTPTTRTWIRIENLSDKSEVNGTDIAAMMFVVAKFLPVIMMMP